MLDMAVCAEVARGHVVHPGRSMKFPAINNEAFNVHVNHTSELTGTTTLAGNGPRTTELAEIATYNRSTTATIATRVIIALTHFVYRDRPLSLELKTKSRGCPLIIGSELVIDIQ